MRGFVTPWIQRPIKTSPYTQRAYNLVKDIGGENNTIVKDI
jgi:hypothetical protein